MVKNISQDEVVYIAVVIMSLWSGAVAYIINESGNNVESSFTLFFNQMIISSFSGFLGGLLSIENEASLPITLCITGVSGTLGIELLRILQRKLLNLIDDNKTTHNKDP